MSGTSGKRWSRAKYLAKRAEQREKSEPEWIANPATGNEFFLRRVSGTAYAVASSMPHVMTNEAVKAWRDQGIEGIGPTEPPVLQPADPKAIRKARQEVDLMAKVILEACVIPKLVPGSSAEDDQELDPCDLDESDVFFIFRWATGQIGGIRLKGGEQVPAETLQEFSEQSDISPGASDTSEELLPAAQ